jgi:ATP-dependent exoDNAse (exonuclease V) beta subunit
MPFVHLPLTPIELVSEMVDGRRLYPVPSGNKYPSITTVLSCNPEKKASIQRWRQRVGEEKANRISNRASSRGTVFHSIVEDYLNNRYDETKYKDKHLPLMMFKNARSTLNRINNIYAQEAALYSDNLEIAGRVDCIAEFDGELSIIDFKTSAEEKKLEWIEDYLIQETAYGCMLYERYKLKVNKIVTIIACESGDTQVFVETPKKEYLQKLIGYIDLYKKTYG